VDRPKRFRDRTLRGMSAVPSHALFFLLNTADDGEEG
jgi:hypothetical protein